MARPRKFYVVYEYGRAIAIAHGLAEARRLHSGWRGYNTRVEAEEQVMWWNYKAYLPGGHLHHLASTQT